MGLLPRSGVQAPGGSFIGDFCLVRQAKDPLHFVLAQGDCVPGITLALAEQHPGDPVQRMGGRQRVFRVFVRESHGQLLRGGVGR